MENTGGTRQTSASITVPIASVKTMNPIAAEWSTHIPNHELKQTGWQPVRMLLNNTANPLVNDAGVVFMRVAAPDRSFPQTAVSKPQHLGFVPKLIHLGQMAVLQGFTLTGQLPFDMLEPPNEFAVALTEGGFGIHPQVTGQAGRDKQ